MGNGLDDETIAGIQDEMKKKMNKIEKDHTKVPSWMDMHRQMTPDFIIKDIKE